MAVVGAFRPDVVVLEWNLRDGGGLGLARRLRDRSEAPLFVIVVSTQNEPASFRESEGADAYLVKPLLLDELEELLTGAPTML